MPQQIVRPVKFNPKKQPGICLMCSAYATKEVLTELEGIMAREVFCDLCLNLVA